MEINLAVTPIAFLIFTVLAYVLFGIGKQMAVPFEKTEGKIAPYLCGEDLDLGVLSPGTAVLFHCNSVYHFARYCVYVSINA